MCWLFSVNCLVVLPLTRDTWSVASPAWKSWFLRSRLPVTAILVISRQEQGQRTAAHDLMLRPRSSRYSDENLVLRVFLLELLNSRRFDYRVELAKCGLSEARPDSEFYSSGSAQPETAVVKPEPGPSRPIYIRTTVTYNLLHTTRYTRKTSYKTERPNYG